MTTSQLKDYLKKAVKLESNSFELGQIKDKIYETLWSREPPKREKTWTPVKPEAKVDHYYLLFWMCLFDLMFLIMVGVLISEHISLFKMDSVGLITFLVFTLPALILTAMFVGMILKDKKKYERELKASMASQEVMDKNYQSAYSKWMKSYTVIKKPVNDLMSQTSSSLSTFYADNTIYPKYRNLAAMSTISEYFETGRVTELTGPNGAYNLYEAELRQNIIIGQLNAILNNLEAIRNNQYMLYQQLSTISYNTNRIGNELSQLNSYAFTMTQLTALNTELNRISLINSSCR